MVSTLTAAARQNIGGVGIDPLKVQRIKKHCGALHLQPYSYHLWLPIFRAAGPFFLIYNKNMVISGFKPY